jgi:hypothetical protein
MPIDNINTTAIQLFLQQVKGADLSSQREIKMDIAAAKNLAYTLGTVMTRLAGNYEGLLQQPANNPVVEVKMDGGSWDKEA